MVRRGMALAILFVSFGIPPARAQQAPQPPSSTPTTLETGFAYNRFSDPTYPMGSLSPLTGITNPDGTGYPSVQGPIAVDSREVVHTIGVAAGLAPDGIHPMTSLVYKNNVPENRRSSGFSDPVILRQVISHTAGETPQPGDSYGIQSIDIMADKDDTIHVFWTESIYCVAPSGSTVYFFPNVEFCTRIFHVARVAGLWSAPSQISPDLCPGFNANNFPNATFQNVQGFVSYDAPSIKKGADGRVYLLVRASVAYDFIVPDYIRFFRVWCGVKG